MPTPTYHPIYTTTTTNSSATSISWTSIPQDYTDLVVVINAAANGTSNIDLTFNGDTASGKYTYVYLYTNGSGTPGSSMSTSMSAAVVGGFYTTQGLVRLDINSYSRTEHYKNVTSRAAFTSNNVEYWNCTWKSTAAINRIDISSSAAINAGSVFTLFGIKAGS